MDALSTISSFVLVLRSFFSFDKRWIKDWTSNDGWAKFCANILPVCSLPIAINFFTIQYFTGPSEDVMRFNSDMLQSAVSISISTIIVYVFARKWIGGRVDIRSVIVITICYWLIISIYGLFLSFILYTSEPFATDSKLLDNGSPMVTPLSKQICGGIEWQMRIHNSAQIALDFKKGVNRCNLDYEECLGKHDYQLNSCLSIEKRCETIAKEFRDGQIDLVYKNFAFDEFSENVIIELHEKYRVYKSVEVAEEILGALAFIMLIFWLWILLDDNHKIFKFKKLAQMIILSFTWFTVYVMISVISAYIINSDPSIHRLIYLSKSIMFESPTDDSDERQQQYVLDRQRSEIELSYIEFQKFCPSLRVNSTK